MSGMPSEEDRGEATLWVPVSKHVCMWVCMLAVTRQRKKEMFYSRDADLKDVVLDQLLPQHDDAELNAQLNEAASWRTLREDTHSVIIILCLTDSDEWKETQIRSQMTNLFHPIIVEDIHVASRSTSKPAKTHKHTVRTARFRHTAGNKSVLFGDTCFSQHSDAQPGSHTPKCRTYRPLKKAT